MISSRFDKITVSGLRDSGSGEPADISLRPGDGLLVHAGEERVWRAFLDTLSGRSRWKKFTVVSELSGIKHSSREIEQSAVLPSPGREVFVGTTVGEQLRFYAAHDNGGGETARQLDSQFGFCFFDNPNRSVWDLSTGERRCLLAVSQSISDPPCWLLHEPLGWLDGACRGAMELFIGRLLDAGKVVLAGTARPEELLGCCGHLLVLGRRETELQYAGSDGRQAAYLAGIRGIGLDLLEHMAERAGKFE